MIALICHSPDDSESAKRLGRALEDLGLAIHTGQEQFHDGGAQEVLGQAISSSDLLFLLWSANSQSSRLVISTWSAALSLKKTVIPCLLDSTPLPDSLRSTPSISFLDFEQGISRINPTLSLIGQKNGTPEEPDSLAEVGTIISAPSRASRPIAAPPPGTTARTGDRELAPGQQIGTRYRIIRLLGRGGMGAVYHAHDIELDRDVALKVIRADMAEDPDTLQRFKREIQLSSVVTHKNVLRVYDLGESEGLRYLTMQYVEGEDLAGLFKRLGRLSMERVLRIFRQICQGLAAAHERSILHRDLKPSNIMIDKDDRVYLTDFGLARSVSVSGLTQTGTLMGTPDYMSPEQVRGEALDVRSDIYSLGVILYQMVTNHVPYSGHTAFEVMIQRVQKPPRPAAEWNPEIPPFVDKILRRCMAIEKLARYATVEELIADLDRGIGSGKTGSGSKFLMRRLQGTLASLTWRKAALGLPLVLLLAFGAYWLRYGRNQTLPTTTVSKPISVLIADFTNRTGDSAFGGSLEQMMDTQLEGASFITTFNRGRARKIAGELKPSAKVLDAALAQLVARREGINIVIDGAITPGGRGYDVAVRALDAMSGKPVSEETTRIADKEDIPASLGKLSARIRRALGDRTPESVQTEAAETFTAYSLDAAKEYAAAQELQGTGQWEKALPFYQRAIQLDKNLGRAYAGVAVMYRNLGDRKQAEKYYQLAMEHIDRMTPRERYRTRGGYFITINDNAKAIEEYSNLVAEYPADFVGHSNLALAFFMSRNMPKALEEGKRATEIYPKNIVMRSNLALYALYAGDFNAAAGEASEILKADRSYGSIYACLALAELALGRPKYALDAYHQLEALDQPGASLAQSGLADIALYQGRFGDAITILDQAIRADQTAKQSFAAARKMTMKAAALLGLGQKAMAAAEAAHAVEESNQPSVLFEAARIYVQAGDYDKALKIASDLDIKVQSEPRMFASLIEGEAMTARKNYWDAIKTLFEAQKLSDSWLGRMDLGLAYLGAEEYTEAYSEFEQCLKRQGEATAVFLDDIPTSWYFPPVYYFLGRTQQGLNSPAAAESFRSFLKIKETSAPDPLVADAKKRLGNN